MLRRKFRRFESIRKSYKRRAFESKGSMDMEFEIQEPWEIMKQMKEDGEFDDDELEMFIDEDGSITEAGYDYANDIILSDIENAVDQIESKFGYDWVHLDERNLGYSFSINEALRDYADSDLRHISVQKIGNIACIYMDYSNHDGSFTVIGCNTYLDDYIPGVSDKALLMYFNSNPSRNFNWVYKTLLEDLMNNNLNDNEYHLIYGMNSDFANACVDGKKTKREIQEWCKRHVTPNGVVHALGSLPKDEQGDVFFELLGDDTDEVEGINAVAINKIFGNASHSSRRSW